MCGLPQVYNVLTMWNLVADVCKTTVVLGKIYDDKTKYLKYQMKLLNG